MITLTINNRQVEVTEGASILDAADKLDIHIPTLCHLKLEEMDMENKAGGWMISIAAPAILMVLVRS